MSSYISDEENGARNPVLIRVLRRNAVMPDIVLPGPETRAEKDYSP